VAPDDDLRLRHDAVDDLRHADNVLRNQYNQVRALRATARCFDLADMESHDLSGGSDLRPGGQTYRRLYAGCTTTRAPRRRRLPAHGARLVRRALVGEVFVEDWRAAERPLVASGLSGRQPPGRRP
jgi:hypothetical protein